MSFAENFTKSAKRWNVKLSRKKKKKTQLKKNSAISININT